MSHRQTQSDLQVTTYNVGLSSLQFYTNSLSRNCIHWLDLVPILQHSWVAHVLYVDSN